MDRAWSVLFCTLMLALLLPMRTSYGLAFQQPKPEGIHQQEGAGGNPNREKLEREKLEREEKEKAEIERGEAQKEKMLRERVLFIADALLESNDLPDKLESACLKAALASLVCASGQRERAVEVVRKSLREAFAYAVQRQTSKDSDRERIMPETLIVRVAESATKCDPSARKLIEDDLARMRASNDQDEAKAVAAEPPVVEDKLWGTRPSTRRVAAAELLARGALDELKAGRAQDAAKLLSQSLKYCVVNPFIIALTRMKSDQNPTVRLLYLQAERQVQSMPSGEEISVLNFGLARVTDTSPFSGGSLQVMQKASQDAQTKEVIEGFLDAITALVFGKDATSVAKSVDSIRMVKDKLPLFEAFRPDTSPRVQSWVVKAIQALAPPQQHIAENIPSAPHSQTNEISRIEEIAEKSGDAAERDRAYASLASNYIDWGKFDKASDAISKISGIDLKVEMQDSLRFNQIRLTVDKAESYLEVGRLIEKISSAPLRARSYIRLGASASKKDRQYANESLQEAITLSVRLDPSPMQSHLLLDVAAIYANFDWTRAVETLNYAVKSLNKHDNHPPSPWVSEYHSTTMVKFDDKFSLGRTVVDDPEEYNRKPYDLSVFRKLARVDFDGGQLAAATLASKSLMASAKYELCAGVLLVQPTKEPATIQSAEPPPSSKRPGSAGER